MRDMTVRRPGFVPGVLVLAMLPGAGAAQQDSLIDLFDDLEDDAYTTPAGPPAASGAVDYGELHRLSLRIDGVASSDGKVIVLVYDEEQAYRTADYTRAVGFSELAAARGSLDTSLPVLGDGPYAVFAYHDANADSQLNMKAGRPLEGYGYTGAIDPYFPPTFEQAAIVTDAGSIRLVYLPQRRR